MIRTHTLYISLWGALVALLLSFCNPAFAGKQRCEILIHNMILSQNLQRDKESLISAMIELEQARYQWEKGNDYSLTPENRKRIRKEIKRWDLEKEIHPEQLYKMVDAFYVAREGDSSFLLGDSIDSVIRRRWQSQLYTDGIIETLSEMGLIKENFTQKEKLVRAIKKTFKGVLNLLMLQPPNLDLIQSKKMTSLIQKIESHYNGRNMDELFMVFSYGTYNRAATDKAVNVIKKAIGATFAIVLGYIVFSEVDEKIFPISDIGKSRELVIDKLLSEVEKDWMEKRGRQMSPRMRKLARHNYEQMGFRELILEYRKHIDKN